MCWTRRKKRGGIYKNASCRVAHMNESGYHWGAESCRTYLCCTYDWVVSHKWISPVTHTNSDAELVERSAVGAGICTYRIYSLFLGSFALETYHFKEPTHRSHPTTSALSGIYKNTLSCVAHINESCYHWGAESCRAYKLFMLHICFFLRHKWIIEFICVIKIIHVCLTVSRI